MTVFVEHRFDGRCQRWNRNIRKGGVLLSVFIENEAEWCKANFFLMILCQKFTFFSINPELALHVIRSKWCNMSCIIRIRNISLLQGHSLFWIRAKTICAI